MFTLSPELLSLLADPETHETMALATEGDLTKLRAAVREGRALRHGGAPAGMVEFDGALLSQGGRVAYVIESGIPNLLIDERLELSQAL